MTDVIDKKRISRSKFAEDFLEDIAQAIQVSDSRYEEATDRYHSVKKWLKRPQSSLKEHDPDVSLQGSFKLGTVIKPVCDEEEYDIDLVCVVAREKNGVTQKELKGYMGVELKAYTSAHGMEVPEAHRRCWRIHYANAAQFHLDALPAIPDDDQQRIQLKSMGINEQITNTALAITDETHPNYAHLSRNWPSSNPEGYAEWFYSRMRAIFDARRQVLALAEQRKVSEIPPYKVKTPLQSAIQILKRHRDMTYDGVPEDKPISIIITTLAAHTYNQEATISETLYNILFNMENYILNRNGIYWIPNPTDPRENFADKWQAYPQRCEAFFAWIEKAKSDFAALASMQSVKDIAETMAPVLGLRLVEQAINEKTQLRTRAKPGFLMHILNPPHRQPPEWGLNLNKEVKITAYRRQFGIGSRKIPIQSDGPAVPKNCDIFFEATTNVMEPYEIYWQVVNTGTQATAAGQLRGGFDFSTAELGKNIRREETQYKGSHSMECFIVKNNVCVARSGQFVVNIA
jgi:hypothetical protein